MTHGIAGIYRAFALNEGVDLCIWRSGINGTNRLKYTLTVKDVGGVEFNDVSVDISRQDARRLLNEAKSALEEL